MKNKGSAKAKAKAMIAKVVKAAATKQKQPKKQKANNVGNVSQRLINSAASLGMTMAGKAISRITGVGDYHVKSNSIETSGGSISGEVPHFGKENNSTRVRHREFVTDVMVPSSPLLFSNTSYVINPANAALFPWLSKFAENYQQYRIHGMVLVFKTTTSDYSASGGMGKVAMATNYNVRDSAYANMIELENAEFSVSGKPSMSRVHPIECASNNGLPLVRYVRDLQYDAAGGDDRLYDAGKFQFATQGLPGNAGTVIGELWCSYDIEFYKPIVGRQAAAALYHPVSVPVFSINGGNGTQSEFQIERSFLNIDSSWTRDQLWETMLSPGKYSRVSPLDIQSARISYSPDRPVPDSAGPDVTDWPANWVSSGSRLQLRKKGVYNIRLFMRHKSNQAYARDTFPGSYDWLTNNTMFSNNPSLQTSASRIHVFQDESKPPLFTVLNTTAVGGYTLGAPPDNNFTTAPYSGVRRYGNGVEWTVSVWVYEDSPYGDIGVNVRFFGDTPDASTSTTDGGLKYSWLGNAYLDPARVDKLECTIAYTNVDMQTFYLPDQPGLTVDDKSALAKSIESVAALMPKLRSLGILDI